jgi:hypothetical protein
MNVGNLLEKFRSTTSVSCPLWTILRHSRPRHFVRPHEQWKPSWLFLRADAGLKVRAKQILRPWAVNSVLGLDNNLIMSHREKWLWVTAFGYLRKSEIASEWLYLYEEWIHFVGGNMLFGSMVSNLLEERPSEQIFNVTLWGKLDFDSEVSRARWQLSVCFQDRFRCSAASKNENWKNW